MSEPSYGHQARWAGQSHAAKAIKQSQALRIISLQRRIPCTSQNIKWSLKVYLKCLSHVPEFPRSSSDFWLCKKNSHQERMNPIQRYLGPPCQSRSSGTKCSPGAWAPVLSSLSAKLLSPESPAIFIVGGWGLMGCLGIFKVWKINYSCGGMCEKERRCRC